LVGAAVRRHLDDDTLEDTRQLIRAHVARVEVRPTELAITLAAFADAPGSDSRTSDQHDDVSPTILIVPWTKPPAKRRRDIIAPDRGREAASQPIRAESRTRLVAAIARGRLSLAFLAPSLVKAAVEGRLPRGIGLARLIDAPAEWDQQHRMLGLAS
jgi:site-specific DNA recombinase